MKANPKNCRFFMGANTAEGFVSLFEHVRTEDYGRKVYAIKGGPGCGKSTAIGQIAAQFGTSGLAEYIHCSSDPASLDGAILHDAGLALLDATAPHGFDPDFPGAEGGYIALPAFDDPAGLRGKYPALGRLAAKAKAHYAQAYRFIAASLKLEDAIRQTLGGIFPAQRLAGRADGIITRELPKSGAQGQEYVRFIDGITPRGCLRMYDTVEALADRVYLFEDSFGLATPALEKIREAALARGHSLYACMCPKNPGRLLHIIIPGLSLAFVTAPAGAECPLGAYRHVRVDAYLPQEDYRPIRGKIKLLARISAALTDDAVGEILCAHKLHSQIEELYRPHINIAATDAVIRQAIEDISAQ